jgi:hypothetical protein
VRKEKVLVAVTKAATVAMVLSIGGEMGNYGTIPLHPSASMPPGAASVVLEKFQTQKSPQLFTAVGFLFYRELNSST